MIGPQRGPKSVRAVNAEYQQTLVEYVMPPREEITIYEDKTVRDRQFTGVIVNDCEPVCIAFYGKPK